MSFGFHRLRPGTSYQDYIRKIGGIVPDPSIIETVALDTIISASEPTDVAETLLAAPTSTASIGGYTGDVCRDCQGTRMQRAGHCEVCLDCGTTTGCS